MNYSADIALGSAEKRNALAGRLTMADCEYVFFLETESADSRHTALLKAGAGGLAMGLAAPASSAPERVLEDALKEANRAVHDVKMRNPSTTGSLVSCMLCLLTGKTLYVASVGVALPYFRTPGRLDLLCEPEDVATKLIRDGITSEITSDEDDDSHRPVNGLGTAPTVFAVRRTARRQLPERFELMLCGSGVGRTLSQAHMEQLPLGGICHDSARKLLAIYTSKLKHDSGVLTLRPHTASMTESDSPLKHDFTDSPGRPSRWWLPAVAVLALIAAGAYALVDILSAPDRGAPEPVTPTSFSLGKGEEGAPIAPSAVSDVLSATQLIDADQPDGQCDVAPDTKTTDGAGEITASDAVQRDALSDKERTAAALKRRKDADRRAQAEAATRARRKARHRARLEKERQEREAAALSARKQEQADVHSEDSGAGSHDVVVQVLDFTQDVVVDDTPSARFPMAKTDSPQDVPKIDKHIPDVQSAGVGGPGQDASSSSE